MERVVLDTQLTKLDEGKSERKVFNVEASDDGKTWVVDQTLEWVGPAEKPVFDFPAKDGRQYRLSLSR